MSSRPGSDTCWLYLVRHGATDNNRAEPPRLQGRRTDPALSDEGWEQARRTACFLASVPLDGVFSSPLLRARQTASAIARLHDLSVEIVDDLIEVDVGHWEDQTWEEIRRTEPAAYQAFMTDPVANPYRGGENIATISARVVPAFQRLLTHNPGHRILVVAHNTVNRVYLAHLLGMPVSCYRSVPQDNCSVTLVRYGNGQARAVTINEIFHLNSGFCTAESLMFV